MDDIRRPQKPQRRDYAIPVRRMDPTHRPHTPADHVQPHHSQPVQPTQTPVEQASPRPGYTAHPAHHPSHQEAPHHRAEQPTQMERTYQSQPSAVVPPAPPKAKRRIFKPVLLIALPFIAAALFAAGYSFKSKKVDNTIPPKITQQANFTVYFPSPMPSGYTYMSDSATFQIGQVFYKFSHGSKRVTVKEEPMPQTKPDLNLLAGYSQFDTAVGKVAMGNTFGETTAVVVTPTTVITMNTTGGVRPDELKSAIDNLKNIGQNNQKTNG
ncbi:MAG TPA: hypothetical protein VLF88_03260 [Candidatus Babeliales bacterium]|nr:hypothetical protein [Candidatus Babeliales bacterium]